MASAWLRFAHRPLFAATGFAVLSGNLSAECEPVKPPAAVTGPSVLRPGLGKMSRDIGTYTYPANNPSEDRVVTGSHRLGWSYAAVFDGHGGWQVSEFASKTLPELVLRNVEKLDLTSPMKEVEVDNAVVKAFDSMEKHIIHKVKYAYEMGFGELAKVGSCVLMAIHTKDNLLLANLGDCQAILGSYGPGADKHAPMFATRLNREHNCRVPYEQLQLHLRHPGEDDLVICKNPNACYVKGYLQLTRALGDCYLKYPDMNGDPAFGRSAGRHIAGTYTPPYVLSTPDVYHIRLSPQDSFVILATDGVWDFLSPQESVDIVRAGMLEGVSADVISSRIADRALEISAEELGITLEQLKSFPPGRERRRRHDDTTVAVLFF